MNIKNGSKYEYNEYGTTLQPHAFRPKNNVFTIPTESRSPIPNLILVLHGKALVSEIFAFCHLLEYARGRPGRCGHIHLENFLMFLRVIRVYEGFEGF